MIELGDVIGESLALATVVRWSAGGVVVFSRYLLANAASASPFAGSIESIHLRDARAPEYYEAGPRAKCLILRRCLGEYAANGT